MKKGMNKLKRAIKARGITQQELADMIGITRTELVNKLSGAHGISISQAVAIKDRLHLTTEEAWEIFTEGQEDGTNSV